MEEAEKREFAEGEAETAEERPADPEAERDELNGEPELLYGEDKKPGKSMIRPGEGGEIVSGSTAVSLTDRDRMTLSRIRDLAAETPEVIEALMKADDTPAMVKVRIIDMIWDRAFGKPEATVNFNQAGRSMEASEMRIQALIRSFRAQEEAGEEH